MDSLKHDQNTNAGGAISTVDSSDNARRAALPFFYVAPREVRECIFQAVIDGHYQQLRFRPYMVVTPGNPIVARDCEDTSLTRAWVNPIESPPALEVVLWANPQLPYEFKYVLLKSADVEFFPSSDWRFSVTLRGLLSIKRGEWRTFTFPLPSRDFHSMTLANITKVTPHAVYVGKPGPTPYLTLIYRLNVATVGRSWHRQQEDG